MNCPFPDVDAVIDTKNDDTSVGSVAIASCPQGLTFGVGGKDYVLHCLPDGEWDFRLSNCTGRR